MFSKLIAIILVTSFLTACGAQGGAEEDSPAVGNGPSSSGVITSTSSVAVSSVTASSRVSSAAVSSVASSTQSQAVSSSSRSSQVTSSSRPSSMASSSRSSSSSVATQQVTIQWVHPTQRENGDYLELDEIGGYEIRVRPANSSSYTYHTITGNQTTNYVLGNYTSTMTIEIAVYDAEGLYSQFVPVSN